MNRSTSSRLHCLKQLTGLCIDLNILTSPMRARHKDSTLSKRSIISNMPCTRYSNYYRLKKHISVAPTEESSCAWQCETPFELLHTSSLNFVSITHAHICALTILLYRKSLCLHNVHHDIFLDWGAIFSDVSATQSPSTITLWDCK